MHVHISMTEKFTGGGGIEQDRAHSICPMKEGQPVKRFVD